MNTTAAGSVLVGQQAEPRVAQVGLDRARTARDLRLLAQRTQLAAELGGQILQAGQVIAFVALGTALGEDMFGPGRSPCDQLRAFRDRPPRWMLLGAILALPLVALLERGFTFGKCSDAFTVCPFVRVEPLFAFAQPVLPALEVQPKIFEIVAHRPDVGFGLVSSGLGMIDQLRGLLAQPVGFVSGLAAHLLGFPPRVGKQLVRGLAHRAGAPQQDPCDHTERSRHQNEADDQEYGCDCAFHRSAPLCRRPHADVCSSRPLPRAAATPRGHRAGAPS